MFRNSPEPTKTESEKAFQLSFINSMGNVKAFILSICFAVVFATLLVSATTMAMSIRERTREVAVLKTLGFTRQTILRLYIGEAVIVALTGGVLGCLLAVGLVSALAHAPGMGFFFLGMQVTFPPFCWLFCRGHGGIAERDLPRLSRGQVRYRGGLALHRLSANC